jgi:dimethylargininase
VPLIALTRAVPDTLSRCELTHIARTPIDVAVARAQHERYEQTLRSLGCRVQQVAGAPDMPDSVFIEDTAVVLPEIAVITRPGAESRRQEGGPVVASLGAWRQIVRIEAPATLDGGDVLVAGRVIFVGCSVRTNEDGARQLTAIAARFGYAVRDVPVERCLHLKTAVTAVGDGLLVMNPDWIDRASFEGFEVIDVDPDEVDAANVLRVGDTLVCAASAPRTAERLRARMPRVETIDVSEIAKAEGALTCCSLIFAAEGV